MANIRDSELISINVQVFSQIKGVLPFDVFIRRAEDTYTRLFPQGEELDQDRLKAYHDTKGVSGLYIRRDDYRKYLYYVEGLASKTFDRGVPVTIPKVRAVLGEMTDLTLMELFIDVHLDTESMGHAGSSVKGCVKMLEGDPNALIRMVRLMAGQPYLIKHSVTCSVFSLMLARADEISTEKSLLTIGTGALLHDIGIAKLPFDPHHKEDLDPEEWKMVQTHPQLGKRMLDTVNIATPEIRSIVLHHHEQPNGQGYPNGIGRSEIYYPAKIVAIADCFVEYITPTSFRPALEPANAIQLMSEDRGRFDEKLLPKFAKLITGKKR